MNCNKKDGKNPVRIQPRHFQQRVPFSSEQLKHYQNFSFSEFNTDAPDNELNAVIIYNK
jgi:hypothetical protein